MVDGGFRRDDPRDHEVFQFLDQRVGSHAAFILFVVRRPRGGAVDALYGARSETDDRLDGFAGVGVGEGLVDVGQLVEGAELIEGEGAGHVHVDQLGDELLRVAVAVGDAADGAAGDEGQDAEVKV